MKNKISKLMLIVALGLVVFSANAASGDKVFEDYIITQVETKNLDAGVDRAWVLSYSDNDSPIVITMQNSKKCKTYIVRADHFEVAYVCSEKGFGVRTVKMTESKVPYEITSQVLNTDELAKQRIISANKVDDDMALGLIAAYLPDLVNPSYQHLLN